MGTESNQWTATPIIDFTNVEANGKSKSMPVFEFPKNYTKAPTLFPNNTSGDINCELCSKTIKISYYIQNDQKKWILSVGSECVTKFGDGLSGKDNVRQFKIDRAIMLDRDLISLKKLIFENSSRIESIGYGKKERKWNSSYANFGTDTASIDAIAKLKEDGKINLLFDTSKKGYNSRSRDYIYWRYVYGAIPIFDYDNYIKTSNSGSSYSKSKESIEKELLAWFTKNEQRGIDFINQFNLYQENSGNSKLELFKSEYLQNKSDFEG